jgi:hypothetical protein
MACTLSLWILPTAGRRFFIFVQGRNLQWRQCVGIGPKGGYLACSRGVVYVRWYPFRGYWTELSRFRLRRLFEV